MSPEAEMTASSCAKIKAVGSMQNSRSHRHCQRILAVRAVVISDGETILIDALLCNLNRPMEESQFVSV